MLKPSLTLFCVLSLLIPTHATSSPQHNEKKIFYKKNTQKKESSWKLLALLTGGLALTAYALYKITQPYCSSHASEKPHAPSCTHTTISVSVMTPTRAYSEWQRLETRYTALLKESIISAEDDCSLEYVYRNSDHYFSRMYYETDLDLLNEILPYLDSSVQIKAQQLKIKLTVYKNRTVSTHNFQPSSTPPLAQVSYTTKKKTQKDSTYIPEQKNTYVYIPTTPNIVTYHTYTTNIPSSNSPAKTPSSPYTTADIYRKALLRTQSTSALSSYNIPEYKPHISKKNNNLGDLPRRTTPFNPSEFTFGKPNSMRENTLKSSVITNTIKTNTKHDPSHFKFGFFPNNETTRQKK